MTAQQAYDEIIQYVANTGYNLWYAGITNDPKRRLFAEHSVNENADSWIYRATDNQNAARAVEEALLKLGFTGGSGGGDSSCIYVYAYMKANHTNEG